MYEKELEEALHTAFQTDAEALGYEDVFVKGGLLVCDTDEKRKKLLDLINRYDLNVSDINLAIVYINDGLDPEFEEDA